MFEFLTRNPGVAMAAIPMLVPIVVIIGYYWHQIQKDASNAELKRDMIARGMSADDIVRVLEAGSELSEKERNKKARSLSG